MHEYRFQRLHTLLLPLPEISSPRFLLTTWPQVKCWSGESFVVSPAASNKCSYCLFRPRARSARRSLRRRRGEKSLGKSQKFFLRPLSKPPSRPRPPTDRPIPDPIKRCRVLKQTCAVGVGRRGGGRRGRWRGRTRRGRRRANRRPIIGKGRD